MSTSPRSPIGTLWKSPIHYPVFLDLTGLIAVVIRDTSKLGESAEERISHLRRAFAKIRLVHPLEFIPADLDGASLIICGSEDEAFNERVSQIARERRIFCNVVDRPALCTWIAPAVVRRGPLQVAVSTGGQSPALAVRLKEEIGAMIGPEYAYLLKMIGELRDRVKDRFDTPEARGRIFQAMVRGPALDLIRQGDIEGAQRVLEEALAADNSSPH
jgi:uroporphyrin-III C-methyltransferase/precorrin-2 dehydrogenase/sirohydrochlorin ferrochelatase